jgi:vacuolar-type H+-ATPase subunit I/STV1
MKKLIFFLLTFFLIGCINFPESDIDNKDELEKRIKNLEDAIGDLKAEKQKESDEEIEEEENLDDILFEVTGVWNEEKIYGIYVFEIDFRSKKNKTLKFKYTPDELGRLKNKANINKIYNISIKNIDNEKNTVSFYITKKGKSFKSPIRENPIWTIRKKLSFSGFSLTLTTEKGEKYDLDYVREY